MQQNTDGGRIDEAARLRRRKKQASGGVRRCSAVGRFTTSDLRVAHMLDCTS